MKRMALLSVMVVFSGPVFAAEVTPPADKRFQAATTAEVPSFQRHVLPLMGRLGCNGRACHGSFQGQGGFRLSLFGYDFKMDHEALLKGESPRVDLQNPRQSLMLAKPTSTDPDEHGGGHRLDVDSWQYRILLRWIEAGAPPTDEDKDPHFVRLEVSPTEIVFKNTGETAQLKVVSHWSDGSAEDVTPLCRFQSNDDAVAKVSESGKITVLGKGDTHIVAFYDNGVVPVPVLLPMTDQHGPNYPRVPTPTKIDELVVQKLRKLGVVPSEVCTDEEFLRRVSLDITGALPRAEEVKAFLADRSSDKRAKKIDELLERPAYAAWWATKFCDILGNSENQLRINNGYTGDLSSQWYHWMNARLAENKPYDKIVEGIVLAKGRRSDDQSFLDYCKEMNSYLKQGSEAFADRETMPHYWARRNMRRPNERALSFSYALLGVRLQCAECHKHPFDQWSQQDFQQFTAFFNRINYGQTDRETYNKMMADLGIDRRMNNGERQRIINQAVKEGKLVPVEEVYIQPAQRSRQSGNRNQNTGGSRVITPKVLGGEEVVDSNYDDPRRPLMDWLRDKDNPYFARALVNRVWAHYFNVGIVEPADDMNLANAPSNRELLDWLAQAFVEHKYDLKWLHRTITGSRTYQLSWKPNATNELDVKNFSHNIPRRLPAEVVYDAVIAATAGSQELDNRAANPVETCAIGLGRGYTQRNNSNSTYALSVFGKPKRETPCDCERSNEPSLLQTVFLRNDREMFSLIDRRGGWLNQLANGGEQGEKQAKDKARKQEELTSTLKSVERKLESLQKEKKKDKDRIAELEKQRGKLRAELRALERQEAPQLAADPEQWVEQAYLRTFNRRPTKEEAANGVQYLASAGEPAEGLRDLLWALLNSKEFVVNH